MIGLIIMVISLALIAIVNAIKIHKLEKGVDTLIDELKPLQDEYTAKLEVERRMVENLKKNHDLKLVNDDTDRSIVVDKDSQLLGDTEDDHSHQEYYYGKNEHGMIGYHWKDREKGNKP